MLQESLLTHNWYPVDGVVKHVDHHNGKFMKAWLPKASTENERSMVVIETPEGHTSWRAK